MSKDVSRRIDIDIAKGIGIIFLITGHLATYGDVLMRAIFSFHMPFFFFISGVFADRSFKPIKLVKSIWLPYMVLLIPGIVLTFLIPSWRAGIDHYSVQEMLYSGQPEILHVGQIWFLVAVFWVRLYFAFLGRVCGQDKYKWMLSWIVLIIVTYCFISSPLRAQLPYSRLPLKMDTALLGLIFFIIGYLLKDFILTSKVNIAVIIAAVVLVVLSAFINQPAVNICEIAIGADMGLFIAVATLSSICIVYLGRLIMNLNEKTGSTCKWLILLGRYSLVAFGLHSFWIYLYEYVYSELSGKEIWHMANLNMGEVVLGTVFITVLSVLSCLIWDRTLIICHHRDKPLH